MVMIPPRPEQEIIDRIYRSYEDAETADNAARGGIYLGRLGASSIGNECLRALWFDWRAYARKNFSGRMLRLFKTGHLQEDRVVADLKAAGLQVFEKDSAGKQFEFTDPTGHLICKVDGIVKGVPESAEKAHVLEIKTHNQTSFNAVLKHGVQKSKEMHYVQMQTGMWLSELTRALYVPLCKNDEQYDVQRIAADRKLHKEIERKVIRLVEARLRPAGISDNAESFACKFCDMSGVCHHGETPLRNCRTCRHCEPSTAGSWLCTLQGSALSQDEQRAACAEYELL